MKHLMIIDSDTSLRESITLALELESYSVSSYSSVSEAVSSLGELIPDLIIYDLEPQKFNRQEFDHFLRIIPFYTGKLIPVLVMTTMDDVVVTGCEILRKPMSLEKLYQSVKNNFEKGNLQ